VIATKQAFCSSTDQGGGTRRVSEMIDLFYPEAANRSSAFRSWKLHANHQFASRISHRRAEKQNFAVRWFLWTEKMYGPPPVIGIAVDLDDE
jgi:hypothetical protein